MFGVPTSLNLRADQLEKLERFKNFLKEEGEPNEYEIRDSEDVSMASYFLFTVYSTGLGDVIDCGAFGYHCDLSIDDDNQLSPDDFEE